MAGIGRYFARHHDNLQDCAICFQALGDHYAELPCKHRFHIACIRHLWTSSSASYNKCPLCRTPYEMSHGHVVRKKPPPKPPKGGGRKRENPFAKAMSALKAQRRAGNVYL